MRPLGCQEASFLAVNFPMAKTPLQQTRQSRRHAASFAAETYPKEQVSHADQTDYPSQPSRGFAKISMFSLTDPITQTVCNFAQQNWRRGPKLWFRTDQSRDMVSVSCCFDRRGYLIPRYGAPVQPAHLPRAQRSRKIGMTLLFLLSKVVVQRSLVCPLPCHDVGWQQSKLRIKKLVRHRPPGHGLALLPLRRSD